MSSEFNTYVAPNGAIVDMNKLRRMNPEIATILDERMEQREKNTRLGRLPNDVVNFINEHIAELTDKQEEENAMPTNESNNEQRIQAIESAVGHIMQIVQGLASAQAATPTTATATPPAAKPNTTAKPTTGQATTTKKPTYAEEVVGEYKRHFERLGLDKRHKMSDDVEALNLLLEKGVKIEFFNEEKKLEYQRMMPHVSPVKRFTVQNPYKPLLKERLLDMGRRSWLSTLDAFQAKSLQHVHQLVQHVFTDATENCTIYIYIKASLTIHYLVNE